MLTVAAGWELDVTRGPGWLVVRLRPKQPDFADCASLADDLWAMLERYLVYRLVLELDQIKLLDSSLIGQLLLLDRRVRQHDGLLRLCGLSAYNQEVLRRNGLAGRLPNYDSPREALMATVPCKPR